MSQDLSDAITFKHSTAEAEHTFIVSWCFFNLCNYDCSYCPPNLKSGSLKGLPLETVKEIVDELRALHPTKKFLFEFTGGEITPYRDFTEMVTYLRDQSCDVNILSNGSRPLAWWKQHAPLLKHVCLSFHLERANADHYAEILEVITQTTTANDVIGTNANKWQGWHCSAGLEMLIIDWQGDIHRAWCKVGGKIGNISERPIAWLREKVVCTKPSCRDGLDVMSTKERVP
jgi:MoaA/NifB/PqqE/SkfB family radical SAM enzyme